MALTKKLTAVGNSFGIVIDKPVLELLAITKDTELQVSTDDGRRIIIEPRPPQSSKLERAHARAVRNHGETFRKLSK